MLHGAAPSCIVWIRVDTRRLGSGHPTGTSGICRTDVLLVIYGRFPRLECRATITALHCAEVSRSLGGGRYARESA